MSSPEKLAVVVPAFNEPGIARTLEGLYNQQHEGAHHFIVDNASTDDTRTRIEAFARYYDDFPLTILTEEQKGTGFAVGTGFQTAVDRGYSLVARTDSDTVPTSTWTSRIVNNFGSDPHLQLLGGKIRPLHDESYRLGDELLLPTGVKIARGVLALKHADPRYLKAVVGANMATTAQAYETTGGFAKSSIDTLDEDIDYSLKVNDSFGSSAIRIDPELEVTTSMRRIRAYGIGGTAIHHLFPERRKNRKNGFDIR